MSFELIDFKLHPTDRRIGRCLVAYGNLLINCDLVYHKKDNKVWIRMPEQWITVGAQRKKQQYCFWKNQKESDKFQEFILAVIYQKNNLNVEKIASLHASGPKKKHVKKRLPEKHRQLG